MGIDGVDPVRLSDIGTVTYTSQEDDTYAVSYTHLDVYKRQSPFNAWLIMRGSVTFPLRMKQHNENALKVASWLQQQEHVSFVAHPLP